MLRDIVVSPESIPCHSCAPLSLSRPVAVQRVAGVSHTVTKGQRVSRCFTNEYVPYVVPQQSPIATQTDPNKVPESHPLRSPGLQFRSFGGSCDDRKHI